MKRRLERVRLLQTALASMRTGRGVSASIVFAFRFANGAEQSAARLLLLGFPPRSAMASLQRDEGKELGMLATLLAMASSSDTIVMGRKGSELATILEKWVKAGEEKTMEARVLQTRGLIMSAVLAALMAMVATLGPIVASNWLFGAGETPAGPGLYYAAAAMVAVSSALLGAFLSGRRFYVNLIAALAVYGLVLSAASPLASVPPVGAWVAK